MKQNLSRQPATIRDLAPIEQVKFWGMLELWTIDEAALIMAGIDPDNLPPSNSYGDNSFDFQGRYAHWEQFKFANIVRRAVVTAIAVGELSPFELWCEDTAGINYSRWKAQPGYVPDCEEVITDKTRLKPKTIGVWFRNKGHKTFRQIVAEREASQPATAAIESPSVPLLQIEYRPLEPLHDTPEYEVAGEVVDEIWNKQKAGVKPPKQAEIQELIARKLESKLGYKPSQAQIDRVDRLTRPQLFKNQSPTAK